MNWSPAVWGANETRGIFEPDSWWCPSVVVGRTHEEHGKSVAVVVADLTKEESATQKSLLSLESGTNT